MEVVKIGRIIGEIIGILKGDDLVCRIDELLGYLIFFDCYYVIDKEIEDLFFRDGDLGFGVFFIDDDGKLKFLGIVFVYLFLKMVVCKIDSIVDIFDLEIVRYVGNE